MMDGFGEEAAHVPLPLFLGPHGVQAVLSEIIAGEGVFTFECEQMVEFGEEGFFMLGEAEVKLFLSHYAHYSMLSRAGRSFLMR